MKLKKNFYFKTNTKQKRSADENLKELNKKLTNVTMEKRNDQKTDTIVSKEKVDHIHQDVIILNICLEN